MIAKTYYFPSRDDDRAVMFTHEGRMAIVKTPQSFGLRLSCDVSTRILVAVMEFAAAHGFTVRNDWMIANYL